MPTAFRITGFGGIAPRVAARLLPANMAQIASNVKITSGDLTPMGASTLATLPTKTLPPLAIYLAREGVANTAWFTWPTDVDVVRAPLSVDVESRFYWTGEDEPKYATFTKATLSGTNNYPSNYWSLGVPTPLATPTVTPSGGVGAADTRLYCYTFFSELGEESGQSPASAVTTGKVDDTWAIAAMDAVPPNSGDINALTFSTLEVTITTTNNHFNRVGENIVIAGVTTVTNVNGTWTLTAVNAATKTMTFSVTSTPVGTYNNATDTTDTWTREVAWNTTNMKRRLYRSAGTEATFQLVDDDVSTTYNDTILDAALPGDELISGTWALPPVGLTGLVTHPSGAIIGFSGNLLCMSEPYQPHAWPPEYQLATDYEIVGLAVFGSEVLVTTRGNPYVASGAEPLVMTLTKTNTSYPNLSKRSTIGVGNGAVYASGPGLVFVGDTPTRVFTEHLYTEAEWSLLDPTSMVCEFSNGKIYVAFTDLNATEGMLILEGDVETTTDTICSELYVDTSTGQLYLGDTAGVQTWDEDDANPLSLAWRSKDFQLSTPVNFGAAKVEFSQVMSDEDIATLVAAYVVAVAANDALVAAGDVGGDVNSDDINGETINGDGITELPASAPSNEVAFTLYSQSEVLYSRTISSDAPFRLPAGYKYDRFSVEVITQNRVTSILIGETIASLKTV